ncbi:MAG: SDR family oxidoreductase [Kutzneria sp.]|nr:SDR family oxidoreductase [Kutzneria sp.]
MSDRLNGLVAMVTGASSGIGEATALALAEQGATVVLLARRRDRIEALAARIGTDRALTVEADVSDREAVEAAVERVVGATGRLDVLVNNAGTGVIGPVQGADVAQWETMVAVDLLGVLYCTHAALPHLLAAAAGERAVADVVTISSVAGRVAKPNFGVYAATKHGVGAFSESLRAELAGRQVRVGLVEPGVVHTELTAGSFPSDVPSLHAGDVADAVTYMVTRPPHAAVNEILIRPSAQER